MASTTLDGSGEVCVCLMEMSKRVKNKALVDNYTIITCVFRRKATAHYRQLNENMFSPCPSKLFDKFEKLSIQVRKNERLKEWERN